MAIVLDRILLSFEYCINITLSDTFCPKLEILNLAMNNLPNNINILENDNWKELKELYLSNHNISNIKVLEK